MLRVRLRARRSVELCGTRNALRRFLTLSPWMPGGSANGVCCGPHDREMACAGRRGTIDHRCSSDVDAAHAGRAGLLGVLVLDRYGRARPDPLPRNVAE